MRMRKIKYNLQRELITYTLFIAYPIAQTLRAINSLTFSDAFLIDLRGGFWLALVALLGEEVFRKAINIFYRAKGHHIPINQNEDEK